MLYRTESGALMLRETRGEREGRRTRAAGLAALALAAGTAVLAPPSAWAAPAGEEPRLVISVDGQAWVRDVTTPVFDPAHVWTPADSKTYTVQFRNDSGQDAEGFAELSLGGAAADLFDTRLRVDSGPWVAGPRSETVAVAPGQVVVVEMDLAVSETSTNPLTSVAADLAATITLRGTEPDPGDPVDPGGSGGADDRAGTSGTGTGPGSGGGVLATTGTTVAWAGALALGALLAGRSLHAATRRRSRLNESAAADGAIR